MEEDPSGQLTWSNLFISLDSKLTIWPVVVFPMGGATQGEVTEIRKETENRMHLITLEHNTMEHVSWGSWVVSAGADDP